MRWRIVLPYIAVHVNRNLSQPHTVAAAVLIVYTVGGRVALTQRTVSRCRSGLHKMHFLQGVITLIVVFIWLFFFFRTNSDSQHFQHQNTTKEYLNSNLESMPGFSQLQNRTFQIILTVICSFKNAFYFILAQVKGALCNF